MGYNIYAAYGPKIIFNTLNIQKPLFFEVSPEITWIISVKLFNLIPPDILHKPRQPQYTQ